MAGKLETARRELVKLGKKFSGLKSFPKYSMADVRKCASETPSAAAFLGFTNESMTPLEWLQVQIEHDTEVFGTETKNDKEALAFAYLVDGLIGQHYPSMRAQCLANRKRYIKEFSKL